MGETSGCSAFVALLIFTGGAFLWWWAIGDYIPAIVVCVVTISYLGIMQKVEAEAKITRTYLEALLKGEAKEEEEGEKEQ